MVERASDGRVVGYTGMWVYNTRDNEWRIWPSLDLPPPRMNAAFAVDPQRRTAILFGGDSQSDLLGDAWLLDLERLRWRRVESSGPAPRAGHFLIHDPAGDRLLAGGGYNRRDLNDLWALDLKSGRWSSLAAEIPPGPYLANSVTPEGDLALLTPAGPRTIALHGRESLSASAAPASPVPEVTLPDPPAAVRFANRWEPLANPGPLRRPGFAVFDTTRNLLLYLGGDRPDVDAYDPASQTWLVPAGPREIAPRGASPAGVSFRGAPWVIEPAAVAYDPASRSVVAVLPVRVPEGYRPEPLRNYPGLLVTWSYDPAAAVWRILGPAPAGLTAIVSTRQGILGAAGALYRFDSGRRSWVHVADPPPLLHPPEVLAYDSTRDQLLILARAQLWTFHLASRRFEFKGTPPVEASSALYVPPAEEMLVGSGTTLWAYRPGSNVWVRPDVPPLETSPDSLLYHPFAGLVLAVTPSRSVTVQALRYRRADRALNRRTQLPGLLPARPCE